jgi:urease gamma subunit
MKKEIKKLIVIVEVDIQERHKTRHLKQKNIKTISVITQNIYHMSQSA